MIINSKEKDFPATKKEGAPAGKEKQLYKALSASSRQWSSAAFHNPRIVRVSRTFGGKDRHSKVCTVRGLRDRRIRLSVPTAVQLYDLQDRLGLSQPSKVIDWLIDATKQDIDKLPPLQIPQGVLGQFLHHPNIYDHHHLNLLPHHDHHHHHQAKTNAQDQFVEKLFGNISSTASYMSTTHHQNPDQTTSLLGHGISLPGGQYFDGLGHGNLVMSTYPSTTPSSINPASIQSVSQLFFCPPPPPPPSNSTASLFGNPYPPYISISHQNNPHYTIRSPMINNRIQLLSGSSSISTSNASCSSPSSQQYHNHHHHVLNSSLMSSLHDITNSNNNNHENRTPLMKSFPAILNPRQLFAQSTSTSAAYENQLEKDRSAAD